LDAQNICIIGTYLSHAAFMHINGSSLYSDGHSIVCRWKLNRNAADLGSAYGDRRGARDSFYQSTVAGRIFLAAALAGICAFEELPASLLILAVVNLFGAVSMWLAIEKDNSKAPPPLASASSGHE